MENRKHYTHKHPWKSIGTVILALLVLFALIVGGLQLWGTGKMKPSNWGKKDPAEEPPATEQDASGGLEIEEPDAEADTGIQLTTTVIPRKLYAQYGIMPIAETAMQVTATIGTENDEPAEDGKLDWQLVWKDPQSEWATDKTVSEYVTIQVSDDTLTATLSCLQAFGEQIQLTAQIKTNAAVKSAPRTVNYVQRYDETSYSTAKIIYTNSSYPDADLTWDLSAREATNSIVKFPGYAKTYQEFLDFYSKTGSKKGQYSFNITVPLTKTYTKEAKITKIQFTFMVIHANVYQGGGAKISTEWHYFYNDEKGGQVFTEFDFTKVFAFITAPTNWAAFKQYLRDECKKESNLALGYALKVTINGTEQSCNGTINFDEDSFGTFANSVDIGSGDIDFV